MRRHQLLLLLLLALVGPPALASRVAAEPPSPGARRIATEVAALASAVAADPSGVAFVSTRASLNFVPGHAWILSLWVEDAPAYGGTFFVLTELDGRALGELLAAPGPEGTRVLEGEALARYLERVELDVSTLRAAFERRYPRRPGRPPR